MSVINYYCKKCGEITCFGQFNKLPKRYMEALCFYGCEKKYLIRMNNYNRKRLKKRWINK
jgi:hypothetical protein